MKPLWRKNFEIKRVDLNIAAETMPGFGGLNYLTVGRNFMTQGIWVFENLDNTATYFPAREMRALIKATIRTIVHDPARVDRVHREAIALNRKYFRFAESLRRLNLKKLSNKKLMRLHKKLFDLQYQSHCWALPTTWYLDSDGEDFSKVLLRFLEKRIKKLKLNLQAPVAFSVLSTPAGGTMAQQEEEQSLRLVDWIQKTPRLKHWFATHTTGELTKLFGTLPAVWQKKLSRHHYQWCWLPYTYLGPAYDLDYFLEIWRGLIHEDINPIEEIKNLHVKVAGVQRQKRALIKALQLSRAEIHWFAVAADIVWLKGYRKDCYFHGFYVLDLLLAEVARRTGLSLLQGKYLLPSELRWVLAGEDLTDLANARIKFSVMHTKTPPGKNLHWTEREMKIYTGKQARYFLKKQRLEKVKVVKTDKLSGTCACPGQAQGIVKIVNVPDEMTKMREGDIMLTHSTFPALVPAMKKAAAIITEDGGITCHAAIVARELQTPCIVGCKNAIANLKDGDRVEVNATDGVIKKILP